MTQPKFALIEQSDEVRPTAELETAESWFPHRPSEQRPGKRATGRGTGTPGPDQGYALLLSRVFRDRLVLTTGENEDDAIAAGVIIGLRRAAQFGRAPIRTDIEYALNLFGFLAEASPELVVRRKVLIGGISHDYRSQRELADALPESLLAYPIGSTDTASLQHELISRLSSNLGG